MIVAGALVDRFASEGCLCVIDCYNWNAELNLTDYPALLEFFGRPNGCLNMTFISVADAALWF